MKIGDPVELKLKDGDRIVGYFQYKENKTVFLSPFSNSQMVFGTSAGDIKKIKEFVYEIDNKRKDTK